MSHRTRPPPSEIFDLPILNRRTLFGLGALGALGALSGCALNNPYSAHSTPADEAVADLAPDVRLAVEGVTSLQEAAAVVTGTAGRFPRLVGRIDGFGKLHAAHLAVLADAVPDRVDLTSTAPAYIVPAGREAAFARLVRVETRLRATLAGKSLRAESGEFARLLGSMAAGVAQQLAQVRR